MVKKTATIYQFCYRLWDQKSYRNVSCGLKFQSNQSVESIKRMAFKRDCVLEFTLSKPSWLHTAMTNYKK